LDNNNTRFLLKQIDVEWTEDHFGLGLTQLPRMRKKNNFHIFVPS